MHMLKLLSQELMVWPTLTPGNHKQFHLCASGLQAIQDGVWPIVLQGEMTTAQDTAKDHRSGQECCRF